jgi:ABC-2 type transport system permease protein
MKFTTITKWEFMNTIKSRKFMMIFFLQLSVLLLMIIIFNSFVTNIESEKGISITPSLNGFATMDVQDQSGLISKYVNPEIINITNTANYNGSLNSAQNGLTTGFLYVPGNADSAIQSGHTVNMILYLDASDPKGSVVLDEVNNTANIIAQSYSSSLTNSANTQNQTSSVNQQTTGESLPLQIIKKVMVVILMFLPLLLFGNIIIDSVVGEKERKTGEILIAMPMSHSQIIIGKSLAVALTISLQVIIWLIILILSGFKIDNPELVFIFIFLTSIPIIGITTIVAAYSKNYKEAGIGLSIAYLFIVGFLIVPVLFYISRKTFISNISPMTIVMRLFSGESIPLGDYAICLAFIFLVSLISYWIAIKLFERDDVTFGPRPGIFRLIFEFITLKNLR